jgi:hypothetical protein
LSFEGQGERLGGTVGIAPDAIEIEAVRSQFCNSQSKLLFDFAKRPRYLQGYKMAGRAATASTKTAMINATQWASIGKDFVDVVTFRLTIRSNCSFLQLVEIGKTGSKGMWSRGERTYT